MDVGSRVIGTSDHDTLFVLQSGHNFLAQMDPLLWDLTQQNIVQVGSCH